MKPRKEGKMKEKKIKDEHNLRTENLTPKSTDDDVTAIPYDHQDNTGLPVIPASRSDIAWMTTRRVAKGLAASFLGTLPVLIKYGDPKIVLLSTAIATVVLGGDKLINETRKAQGKRTQ